MAMSKLVVLPEFELDSCDSEVTSIVTHGKRKRGEGHVYLLKSAFNTKDEAEHYVQSQKQWSKYTRSTTEEGDKEYYRCNQAKSASCPAKIYLLFHSSNQNVSLFMNDCPHQHESKNDSKVHGLSKEQKNTITQLIDDGVTKPKAILSAFSARGYKQPPITQLNSFLLNYRRKKFGGATINVNDLIKCCEERRDIPANPDQPFVLSHRINMDKETRTEELGIFLSTVRLLKLALNSTFVQTDSTYKLNWQGYPVLIVGTSDRDRAFHPFGLALCYSEKEIDFEFIFKSLKEGIRMIGGLDYTPTHLMADGADAITNGFTKVFGTNYSRLMCYFHVMKNVDVHLRSLPVDARKGIRHDIEVIQLCQDKNTFEKAAQLFLTKWKSDSNCLNFVEYFEKQWLNHLPNWYEGAGAGIPSTNNSLEATNSTIKKEHTVRERLPVAQFLELAMGKILPSWSNGRDPSKVNHKQFSLSPSKSLELWTKSYQWALSGVKVLSNGLDHHYVPSSDFAKSGVTLTEEDVHKFDMTLFMNWKDFDDFFAARTNMWCITLKAEHPERATCNCPVFLKQYQCKHSLGLAIRLKLVQVPDAAKTIPLGQKRKPGRPKKARAALVME